jgi:hypothetical protein
MQKGADNWAEISSDPTKESVMRKTALLLAGLMAVSVAVFAAEAPAGDMSKDKGTMSSDKGMAKGSMDKGMAKAKAEKTSGELTAVDDAAKKGTLKAKDGKEWSFTWDDKTVVSPKDAKMEVGGNVTVTHAKDSDLATKVLVHKAKKMAAKAEKKS